MNTTILTVTIVMIIIIILAIGATLFAQVEIADNGGIGFAHTEAYNRAHGLIGPVVSLPDGYTIVEKTTPIDIGTALSYTVVIKENTTCFAEPQKACV